MSSIRRGTPPTLSTGTVRPRSPAEALEPGRAPSRPRARRERKASRAVGGLVRVVSGVMTLVLLVMAATGGMIFLLHHLYGRPGPLEVSRTIAIPKGEGRIEIAERLEKEGVISNRWVFLANHMFEGWYGEKRNLELKAGEYEIRKNASMREVMEELAEGKSVLYKVTIPEGLTSQQIVDRLNDDPNLTGEITTIPPEGSLLPDTYRFSKGMDRNELIARMQSEQARFIDSIWDERQQGLPVDSKERALILASIIEKETGRADERERVAGVFVNRLKKRMRLQSDPTIIYGLVGGQATLGRSITPRRPRPEDGLQHLSDRRAAAEPDLQPRSRRHRGDAQARRHQRSLLRRRRHRRAHLLRHLEGAQRGRCRTGARSRRT